MAIETAAFSDRILLILMRLNPSGQIVEILSVPPSSVVDYVAIRAIVSYLSKKKIIFFLIKKSLFYLKIKPVE